MNQNGIIILLLNLIITLPNVIINLFQILFVIFRSLIGREFLGIISVKTRKITAYNIKGQTHEEISLALY